jgi:prepilin-type N-terminal cleavage/methylation domain-containing protein
MNIVRSFASDRKVFDALSAEEREKLYREAWASYNGRSTWEKHMTTVATTTANDLSRPFMLDVDAAGCTTIREKTKKSRTKAEGLPVFSTNTREEAELLVQRHCRRARDESGNYFLNDPPRGVEDLQRITGLFRKTYEELVVDQGPRAQGDLACIDERAALRGLTLFEVMVVVAVLAVLAVVVGSVGCNALLSGDDVKKDAEHEARQYATDMNIKVDGISCGDRANSKGQVYCSLRSGKNTNALSCIGKYKFGHGCKQITVVAPGAEPAEP